MVLNDFKDHVESKRQRFELKTQVGEATTNELSDERETRYQDGGAAVQLLKNL